MSNRRLTLISFTAIAAAAIVMTSTASFSQSNAAHLAGSWKGAVVATSPPGLTPFTSLITFTSDGSVIETRRLLVPEKSTWSTARDDRTRCLGTDR